jgi:hypothetical protein
MNSLVKIIIGVIVLIGVVILGIFMYGKYSGEGNAIPSPTPAAGALPYSASVMEEVLIKSVAESFIGGYGSYQKGTFDSLKEVRRMMTKKYQEETTRLIEEKEKEQAANPPLKEYISYVSVPEETTVLSTDPQGARVIVIYERNTFHGVNVYVDGVLTTLDESGKKTIQPLRREASRKNASLIMLKEDGTWKVDSVKINDL